MILKGVRFRPISFQVTNSLGHVVNPGTAKTGLLIVTALIVAAVVIFFRKPPEDRQAEAPSRDSDQSLVLRRSVAGPKPPVESPQVAKSITAIGANPDQNDASQEAGFLSAAKAQEFPSTQEASKVDTPTATAGFVPPSISTLPPETPHGDSPFGGLLVDVPPVSTANVPSLESVSPPESRQSVSAIPGDLSTNVAASIATQQVITPEPEKKTVLKTVGPPRYHRIVDGDTLEKISIHYFGTADRAKELFELNRNVLDQPDLLPLRKKLLVPPETREFVVESEPAKPQRSDLSVPNRGNISLPVPTPTTSPMPESVLNPIPDDQRIQTRSQVPLVPVPGR
jgi:nucleoid-associated protein YgaU